MFQRQQNKVGFYRVRRQIPELGVMAVMIMVEIKVCQGLNSRWVKSNIDDLSIFLGRTSEDLRRR
jgi:hypothetical protein